MRESSKSEVVSGGEAIRSARETEKNLVAEYAESCVLVGVDVPVATVDSGRFVNRYQQAPVDTSSVHSTRQTVQNAREDTAMQTISQSFHLGELYKDIAERLAAREAYIASLRDPLRKSQDLLARCREAGFAVRREAVEAATDLRPMEIEIERGLEKISSLGSAIGRIRSGIERPSGSEEVEVTKARLQTLQSISESRLSDAELKRLFAKGFEKLANLRSNEKALTTGIDSLRSQLSKWFVRSVLEKLRRLIRKKTRAQELDEQSKELVTIREKRTTTEQQVREKAQAILISEVESKKVLLKEQRTQLETHVVDLKRQLENAEKQKASTSTMLHEVSGAYVGSFVRYCKDIIAHLDANSADIELLAHSLSTAATLPWFAPAWDDWPEKDKNGKPTLKPFISDFIRVGQIVECLPERLAAVVSGKALDWLSKARPVTIPVGIPFIGHGRTIVINSGKENRVEGEELLQLIILRVCLMLGHQSRFTLLDPDGLGRAFPLQRALNLDGSSVRHNGEDVYSDLRAVEQDVKRINAQVLSGETGLEKLEPKRLASEVFEIVAAASFPKHFDRRSVEAFFRLATSGPRAGRYAVIQLDPDTPPIRDFPIDNVTNRVIVDPMNLYKAPKFFRFEKDELPLHDECERLLGRVKTAGREDHSLAWDDQVGLENDSDWWSESSVKEICTPIGLRGGSDKAEVWFGERSGATCAHGMLAGMPGAGKSTLYHVMILGLAVRYSPDDLRMYLIDGKFGVEFRCYETLPHAAVVSLKSPAELTRSVLQEVYDEMQRRNAIFIESEVENLARYRQKTGKKMPRLLLLIDEYQELFEDDPTGSASDMLLRLAQQGRSAGIHLLLGSQKFGAPGMINQAAIFGNMHLRIAMKLQDETVTGLTEFGPNGKRMIKDINVPGKFVLNSTGQDAESIGGQAVNLQSERRQELISKLSERAGNGYGPVVFRGDDSTSVFESNVLRSVMDEKVSLTPKMLEIRARREQGPGLGLGQPRWVVGDRPVALSFGRLFNVHGHCIAMLTRQIGQNLLFVGSTAEARAGFLIGMLVSATCLYHPAELSVDVVHAGGDDDEVSVTSVKRIIEELMIPAGFQVSFHRDSLGADSILAEYDELLESRKSTTSKDLPSRLLVLVDSDRLPKIRRSNDPLSRNGTLEAERLRRVMTEGSAVGLHLSLVSTALSLAGQVIDRRRDMTLFNHRVGLQMSQNDSFEMFGNYRASNLRGEGIQAALYTNMETGESNRFKTYLSTWDDAHLRDATSRLSEAHNGKLNS